MPIYEYRCEACGQQLEKLQRITDDKLKDCPSCAEPKLTRLVSAAGFRLKGSGWYETDFKSGNKKNLAGDAGKADSKSASKSASKSESKPAAKPSKAD